MKPQLENPFYYLDNFHTVIRWIDERYRDLLVDEERAVLDAFPDLPQAARALLVRMIMRKGESFRASKLSYREIGCPHEAAVHLVRNGFVEAKPLLTVEQLCALMKKSEIAAAFGLSAQQAALKKADLLALLAAEFAEARCFEDWCADSDDRVYRLTIGALCERLRLMFFGNLRQDWTEFVLADLGLFHYEKIDLAAASRVFKDRRDVDDYLHLHRCRERFDEGSPLDEILVAISPQPLENDWLEARRAKLLFRVAQRCEREERLADALEIYSRCAYPEARVRAVRVLERCARYEEACALAEAAFGQPQNDAERQQAARMLPRLRRKLGHPKPPATVRRPPARLDLALPRPLEPFSVEVTVRDHLSGPGAPVFYVENTLINSLFGLLFWQVVFAPIPGAFFHPFHSGPADLYSLDFRRLRGALFDERFAQLDSDRYRQTIRENFRVKQGIQSPFVAWSILPEELLELALHCIPAEHLKRVFERMLVDLACNRTGLPDLIQFWPEERRYRLVEVKGPGDRLQDNQIRWLDFCAEHAIPVAVAYVTWAEPAS